MASIDDELEAIERSARGSTNGTANPSLASKKTIPKGAGRSRKGSIQLPGNLTAAYRNGTNPATRSASVNTTTSSEDGGDGSHLLVDFPCSDDDGEDEANVATPVVYRNSANAPDTMKQDLDDASARMAQAKVGQTKDINLSQPTDVYSTLGVSRGGDSYVAALHKQQLMGNLQQRGGGSRRGSDCGANMSSMEKTAGDYGDLPDDEDDEYDSYPEKPVLPSAPPGMGGTAAPNRPMVGGFAAAAYEAMREHHLRNEMMKDKDDIPKRTNGPRPCI